MRLTRVGFDADDIARALDDLEAVGLINDQRFAEELVKDRAGRRLAGDRVIRQELRLKGVEGDDVQRALDGAGDERDRAIELADRQALRFGALPVEAAHRRILGMLMRRGYAPALAHEVTREALSGRLDDREADGDDA